MIGIYMITNTITNKKYIGQSIDIEKRWRTHKKKSTWKKLIIDGGFSIDGSLKIDV